jgi:hypothetical protein
MMDEERSHKLSKNSSSSSNKITDWKNPNPEEGHDNFARKSSDRVAGRTNVKH